MLKNLSLFALIVFTSCTVTEQEITLDPVLPGLASPIQLQFADTEVYFEDYFMNPADIDSFNVPDGLTYVLTDSGSMRINGVQSLPLDIFRFWIDGNHYDILSRKSMMEEVTITYTPRGNNYRSVQLKGEMNSWNPNENNLELMNGVYTTTFVAAPGRYQYMFVINGAEVLDPDNPELVSNGMGGFNNVIKVGNPDADDRPKLKTSEADGRRISLTAENANGVKIFWQNRLLEFEYTDGEYHFEIPAEASAWPRSYLRAWAHDDEHFSNDVLIPLEGRTVVRLPSQLNRTDYHTWNMYFILIDRFYDGNPDNNRPLNDPEVLPIADYHGGDFAGITKKIRDGYFEKIGINALWLSPVTQNPEGPYGFYPEPGSKFSAYHGYWPISSSKVDDRFGTEAEWVEMLDTAHEHGMAVILDYVANHVHELHPAIINNPDWKTDLYLPDGSMNTERWDDHRLTTWFDTFMPTLDFSRAEVIETMSDSALYWIKNYPLDGFRHDATKHIQTEFWRTLTRKIKEEVIVGQNRPVFQVGETYGSRELIAEYIGSGLLDAQFDFALYDAGVAVFAADEPMQMLRSNLQQSHDVYGVHNLMGYISGNHDKARFITLASGEVAFDEDHKLAGWTRDIPHPQPIGYDKLALNMAFIQTIPGMPVIYQGDEFGQPGANDPDNRRMMQFEDEELLPIELAQRELTAKLTHLRNRSMPLLYGNFEWLHTDEGSLIYRRSYFDQSAWVFFNNSDTEQTLSIRLNGSSEKNLTLHFGHDFVLDGDEVQVILPPRKFDILTNY